MDTYASAGHLSAALDAENTRLLLGDVPAAFHAGVQDILLIAYALACTEFLDDGDRRSASTSKATAATKTWRPDIDLSRTVGWFTAKYPVSLAVGGLRWAQVIAGDAALGPVVKNAKEQLRALPDGLTYGLLRYLNADVDLSGADPSIGFNYLGRLGAGAADGRHVRRTVAGQRGRLVGRRRGHHRANAVGPHRGTQRRHRRLRDRTQLHATWTWAPVGS